MDKDFGPISLSAQNGEFVAREVELGHYDSPKAVVEQGLRLLREQEEFLHANREVIRQKIERSAKQAERGELIDGETVWEELDRLDRADEKKKKPAAKRTRKRS